MQVARLHTRSLPDDALRLFGHWIGGPVPNVSTEEHAFLWTTLHLGNYQLEYLDTAEWLRLGKQVDLCFESFSTSLCMGEIVFVLSGEVRRHLLIDPDNPDTQVNIGTLRYENENLLKDWAEIWTFVEDDHWRAEIA